MMDNRILTLMICGGIMLLMYVDGQGLLGCTFEMELLTNGSKENRKKRAILTKITIINIIQAFGSYY